MDTYASKAQVAAKMLALIAAGVFVGVLALVLIRLTTGSGAFPSLAAIFTFSRERILVRAEPDWVVSGKTTALSWTHEGKPGDGSYELRYPCKGDLVILLESTAVTCNAWHPLGNRTAVAVTPKFTAGAPVNFKIAVGFVPNGADAPDLDGETSLTVAPGSEKPGEIAGAANPSLASVPANTQPKSVTLTPGQPKTDVFPVQGNAMPVSVPGGVPDLSIRLVSVGAIDYTTGQFTATSSVTRSEQAAIVFEVVNIGTAASAKWTLAANLPVSEGFFSPPESQPVIEPGEKIRYTIGFKNINRFGENVAVLTVDPDGAIRDANRSNDFLRVTVFLQELP